MDESDDDHWEYENIRNHYNHKHNDYFEEYNDNSKYHDLQNNDTNILKYRLYVTKTVRNTCCTEESQFFINDNEMYY